MSDRKIIYLDDAIDAANKAFDRETLLNRFVRKVAIDAIKQLPSAQPTLYGYNIEHLELIARVLQKENLPPERIAEVLTDFGRIVAIVKDEFEETLRKAAIEVIDAVFPVDPMKSEYAQGIACGAALAKTYVEQLPSAHIDIFPLLTEEEKQQNRWYAEGYGDAIKELSAQPTDADVQKMQDIEQAMLEKAYECGKQDAAQWIPCSERMPDPTAYYLISDGSGTWVSIWNGEDWMSVTGLPITIIDVIAWMPLPEPYAERRTDGHEPEN